MKVGANVKRQLSKMCILAIATSTICNATFINASGGIKLSRTKLTMKVGQISKLRVKGTRVKKVSWKTSKRRIVSIKKVGKKVVKVTAKKPGTAVITAKIKLSGGSMKIKKCKVKINKAEKKSEANMTAGPGTGANLAATAAPQTVQPGKMPTPQVIQPTEAAATPQMAEPTEAAPTPLPEVVHKTTAQYPTIFSDIPDCDFIRVGNAYYMVSTTMNMNPGVPIMKSTDLVHWKIVNYVYDTLFDDDANNLANNKQVYTNGSWAAAIRFNPDDGKFYVCFNSNKYGFFIYTTDDVENGPWKRHFVTGSYHDPSMLFDDGKLYVFYGGGPNRIQQVELDDDKEEVKLVGASKAIIQKPQGWSLWEGCHAYKIGEYYYVMVIASPESGWFRTEICYRTKNLFAPDWSGEWESQIIFQGSTEEYGTGIAQGGIVDTIYGDWYGILFQDHDAIGRIPSILAVNWDYTDKNGKNYKDWPMMGYYDEDGEFVSCQSTKDKVDNPLTINLENDPTGTYIVDSDDFDYSEGEPLKLVWQWNHNPDNNNWSVLANPGNYRITNGKTCKNVYFARNSLTQRTVGPKFVSETAITTSGMKPGDYAGLVAVGSDYGMVGVSCGQDGKRHIFQGSGSAGNARPVDEEEIDINETADEIVGDTKVYLRVEYSFNTGKTRSDKAQFYYSLDGENWESIGDVLRMKFSTSTTFMGARTWLTNYATTETGGYVDFDYYKCW
ncbi:MAG: glycoside hydrolase 43 family protein [Eubacterium sp.]|nr:glycoside hydrolase 43 family protein [Eubacterium sp.]